MERVGTFGLSRCWGNGSPDPSQRSSGYQEQEDSGKEIVARAHVPFQHLNSTYSANSQRELEKGKAYGRLSDIPNVFGFFYLPFWSPTA